MTADRCRHCDVVVTADRQQVWRDRAAQAWCWNGLTRHDVPVNRTRVTPSPLLTVPGVTDQFGRPYRTYADPWGVV